MASGKDGKFLNFPILPVKIPGRRAAGDGGGRVPEPGPAGVRGARRAPEDVVLPGVRDDGEVGVGAACGHGKVLRARSTRCQNVVREEKERVRRGVDGERGCACVWRRGRRR